MDCSPIVLAHEEAFSIGAAEIRPATRELLFNDQSTILEPRVMQMLVALHRAGGGVVTKDDLIKLCWEGRIVGDDAINRVVSRLRQAAEWAGGAFRIETITKVGYRLVGGDGQRLTGKAIGPTDRRKLLIGAASVAAAGGAGLFGWRLLSGSTLDDETRELVEESRSAMMEGLPDRTANAVAKLRSASDRAPDNAEILGLLALAYHYQAGDAPAGQREASNAKSLETARRALAIDEDNGDALAVVTRASFRRGEYLRFEQAARNALTRAPGHPQLMATLGVFFAQVGRVGDALPYFDRLVQALPMGVYAHMWRAVVLWSLGRLDETERTLDHAYRLWPRHFGIWFVRNYFLAYNGRAQEALAMVEDFATRPTGIPDWNFNMVSLQCRALASKNAADIDRAMDAWLDGARRGLGFAQNAIIFAGAVGKFDIAYRIADAYFFNRGFALGEQRYSREQGLYAARDDRHTYFLFHRNLGGFRRDPRFGQLTAELGLKDYWTKSGSRPAV